MHRFASGNGSTSGSLVGGHAYSADGYAWTYDSAHAAYTTHIAWTNGTNNTIYRRERPKLLHQHAPPAAAAADADDDADDDAITDMATSRARNGRGAPVALFTGAWPCHFGEQGEDHADTARGCQSLTMVAPILH